MHKGVAMEGMTGTLTLSYCNAVATFRLANSECKY